MGYLEIRLREAIGAQKVEQVRDLVADGADLEDLASEGATVLNAAALTGNLELVEILLAAGSQVNPRLPGQNHSPLHAALASSGNGEVIRLLIRHGADLNTVRSTGAPLHWALVSKNEEGVRLLIEAGADINVRDSKGDTPLHVALQVNRPSCFARLVAAGADFNATNKAGYNLLHHALLYGRSELAIELINAGVNIRALTKHDETTLHMAVLARDPVIVERLVSAGIDLESTNTFGDSPLRIAVANGRLEMCKYLTQIAADPSFVPPGANQNYLTPFQTGVKNGMVEIVRHLAVECGEDIAQLTIGGRTLMQLAGKNPEMKALLRALKTEIEIRDAVPTGEDAPTPRRQPSMGVL